MIKDVVLEARDVWKGYRNETSDRQWVLRGIDIEVMKGDFIALLGEPGTGKSVLLRVLGFQEPPDRGEVRFEGRLVGRGGASELAAMRDERVLLVAGATSGEVIEVAPGGRMAAILIDEPLDLFQSNGDGVMLEQILGLNRSGVAVVVATREPTVAARAGVIYKLADGKLMKLTGVVVT